MDDDLIDFSYIDKYEKLKKDVKDFAKFDIIKESLNLLVDQGYVDTSTISKIMDYKYSRNYRASLDAIYLMYGEYFNLIIDENSAFKDIIELEDGKNRGQEPNKLHFKENGYRLFLKSNPKNLKIDCYLRYQLLQESIKQKDVENTSTLTSMIKSNIEDALIYKEAFSQKNSNSHINIIIHAILNNKRIKIKMINGNYPVISEPIKIFHHDGYLYLARLGKDGEDAFPTRRIDNIEYIEETSYDCEHNPIIYRSYAWDAWGHEKSNKDFTIIIELENQNIYNYFKVKNFLSQQETYTTNGKYYVKYKYSHYHEVAPMLLSWMNYITIKSVINNNTNKDEHSKETLLSEIKKNFVSFINKS